MKKLTQHIFFSIASLTASTVFAQKSGDLLLNIGTSHIAPNANLQSVSSNEPISNGALQGASASSSSTSTLSFGASYMLTDNVAAEVALGIPPKIKLDLNVPSGNHPNAFNTTIVSPAVLANYYFGSAGDTLRPFVGAGVSYIRFTKNGYNSADPVVSGLASQATSINSTWSPVYKLGASYQINEKWMVNGAALFMPIKVKGSISGPGIGAGPATTDLSMKLMTNVYMVSMGYIF